MPINDVTGIIINEIYAVYFHYGPGLFERVYESALAARLKEKGLRVDRQRLIYINDEYVDNEPAFVADLIVEDCVIIELKSVEKLSKRYFKQVKTYCKLTGITVGILVNFNCDFLKDNIKRIVVDYVEVS